MKYVVLLLCFFGHVLTAQTTGLNNALALLLTDKSKAEMPCDMLVEGDMRDITASQSRFGYTLNYSAGNIASIHCKAGIIPQLLDNHVITYAEYLPPHLKPLNDTMVYRNRIKGVKLWTAPLPQAYNGEGVLMGFVDTGIDFTHGDFKDSAGKTRVKFLWDQVPTSASSAAPQPFNYGIEWTATQINNNQCTHSDLPHYGHGTHVSGIAAGNGKANGTHEGIASKADIMMVALDFNKSGPVIADAINYIFTKANALGKPCAINVSVGDYYGSHDGTDLETKLIENMVKNKPGRVIVAAAGNAGNVPYHTKTQPLNGDTLFTWLNTGGTINYWCYADTAQIRQLKISVGANRADFSNLGRIGFKNYNYGIGSVKYDTLYKANGARIGVLKTSASINSKGVYELALVITPDTASANWRIETTGTGLHHAWNFYFVNSGLPTVTQYPAMNKYVLPDTLYSIVSSFQCSDEIITVGNYSNAYNYYDVTNTLQSTGVPGGAIAPSSSRGPTRDGRVKPDLAASGHDILSTMPMGMQASMIANSPSTVAQGSLHVLGGGTSAASPVVAGLAALYLQRFPTATNMQVKSAVLYCTYTDAYTGTQLPNYQWGFGKLDGKAAMYCGETPYNFIKTNTSNSLQAYPNPFHQSVNLQFQKQLSGQLCVYNSLGALLFTSSINADNYQLNASDLPGGYSGLLVVTITSGVNKLVLKLIKE